MKARIKPLARQPKPRQTLEQVSELTTNRLSVYLRCLNTLDTAGVPATAHVNPAEHERDDTLLPSLPVEEAIANAPDAAPDAGLFRVPRVIGG